MKIKPFNINKSLSDFLRGRLNEAIKQIENEKNNYIANTNEEELKKYYYNKSTIDPLKLSVDEMSQTLADETDVERKLDFGRGSTKVKTTVVEIRIPYLGESKLWEYHPSTYQMGGYPELEITNYTISFFLTMVDNSYDESVLINQINQSISALEEAIGYQKKDILKYNDDCIEEINKVIDKKIQIAKKITGSFEKLGIILDKYSAPQLYIAPIKRKSSPINKPLQKEVNQDPKLDEDTYNHILTVMKSMSLVIERNPKSFINLDEETIRTHFLLQLNGHYKGTATGETFNAAGKTDILITYNGKNIFIAECKFWKGKKVFDAAITQLLSYLSWRDTKCALIIFNKNKDTSKVLKEMHDTMENRKEFKKTVDYNPKGNSRYIFLKESDEEQEISITTQVYDIPKI